MRNTFTILFLTFHICLIAQETWIEKDSESDKFSILFPAKPNYSIDRLGKNWTVKDNNNQVIYTLLKTEAPKTPTNPEYLLENNFLPAFAGSDIILGKKFIIYQNYSGLEFTLKTNNTEQTLYTKGRAIFAGKRLYVILTKYYHSNLEYFEKFANSLKIKQ
ncbi:MAG: hypothetical protein VYB38_11165 [Bacteroidota bacterium]|nr:hypothetical protein [Bacteroidota bacterium]